MDNLYDLLEVKTDADAATIKKAHRSKVNKYHPDKYPADHPDLEAITTKFKNIQEAYDILSNEKSRASYDKYGVVLRTEEELSLFEAAKNKICEVFLAAVEQIPVEELEYVNINNIIRSNISQNEADAKKGVLNQQNNIFKFNKALARLVFKKDSDNFIAKVLHKKIDEANSNIKDISKALIMMEKMKELLDNYGYDTLIRTVQGSAYQGGSSSAGFTQTIIRFV